MVREYAWSVVMAAVAAVAAGVLLTYGARRGPGGDPDQEPRHLPLDVRRNLRVLAFRLLPPSATPLPRWPQRAAPVGAGIRRAASPVDVAGVGQPRSPAGVGNILENVHVAAPLERAPLATPIGTWSSTETPVISDLLKYTDDRDGPKKTEQAIYSGVTEIQLMVQDTETKFEKERQNFLKALPKTSKECEGSLDTEHTKFEATHDKFCKEKVAHVQNCSGKKEKATLSELEKTVSEKIVDAEVSLKKMKQGEKSVDRSEAMKIKLQTCLFSLASREKDTLPEIADAEVSLNKMKQGDGSLKTEYTEFEATSDKFCKDKAAHVQNFKDLFSKSEVKNEELVVQYELQRKKEKATQSEL